MPRRRSHQYCNVCGLRNWEALPFQRELLPLALAPISQRQAYASFCTGQRRRVSKLLRKHPTRTCHLDRACSLVQDPPGHEVLPPRPTSTKLQNYPIKHCRLTPEFCHRGRAGLPSPSCWQQRRRGHATRLAIRTAWRSCPPHCVEVLPSRGSFLPPEGLAIRGRGEGFRGLAAGVYILASPPVPPGDAPRNS